MKTGDEFDLFVGELSTQIGLVGTGDRDHQVRMADNRLITEKAPGLNPVEKGPDKMAGRLGEIPLVIVLDVAFAIDLFPSLESGISHIVTAMQPFEQDGIVVLEKTFHQLWLLPAHDVVGKKAHVGEQSRVALIIIDLLANLLQFGRLGALVFETVEDKAYTKTFQCLEFIIDIDDPAIIWRIRNVERDNIQEMVIHDDIGLVG